MAISKWREQPRFKRIVALRKPTRTLRPPLDGKTLWCLTSHLSLNYLSLVEEGKAALQKILDLYDFSDSPECQKQIGRHHVE